MLSGHMWLMVPIFGSIYTTFSIFTQVLLDKFCWTFLLLSRAWGFKQQKTHSMGFKNNGFMLKKLQEDDKE